MVTEAPILAFYNPAKELVAECDANQKGLGAVLMQQGRPIAYASRALTPTETRYAHIERETLSVVFRWTSSTSMCLPERHPSSMTTTQLKKPMHRAPRRL